MLGIFIMVGAFCVAIGYVAGRIDSDMRRELRSLDKELRRLKRAKHRGGWSPLTEPVTAAPEPKKYSSAAWTGRA